MGAIYKRELRSYFTNVTGCIFLAGLFIMCGILTTALNLMSQYASFEYVLGNTWMYLTLIILIPVLSARSLTEDRKNKTDQLLYSLPVNTTQVVLAKYFALVTVFAIGCGVIALVPVILSAFGDIAFGAAYLSLLGFFLLGAALMAICMFFSSLTESQIIAAILGIVTLIVLLLISSLASMLSDTAAASFICFFVLILALAIVLYVLTKNYLVAAGAAVVLLIPLILWFVLSSDTLAGAFPDLLNYLAVFDRLEKMTGGIFDITAVIYYLSIIVFFVFSTVQSMEKRRWS